MAATFQSEAQSPNSWGHAPSPDILVLLNDESLWRKTISCNSAVQKYGRNGGISFSLLEKKQLTWHSHNSVSALV